MEQKTIDVGLSETKLDKKSNVNPITAFKEIIWNACDADANNIVIEYEKNVDFSGKQYITKIVVKDNGHGLNYNNTDVAFSNFGESEKATKYVSPGGRKFHGKLGEGRYTYFSLGNNIKWVSNYFDNGKYYELIAIFNKNNKKSIKLQNSLSSRTITGMRIEVIELLEKNYYLDERKFEIMGELVSEFAGYLLAHNEIKIIYDGTEIDVNQNIDCQKDYSYNNNGITANVKIIKWKNIKSKQRYICGNENTVYQEDTLKSSEDNISVYISSSYFDELKNKGLIDAENYDEIYMKIIDFANSCLKQFVDELILKNEKILLEEIQNDDSYPFSSEVSDPLEKEQQKLFDIVAVEIAKNSPQIRKSNNQNKKLTNQLILEAIKTNPSSLKKILKEVFNLTKEKQNELAEILEHTSLNNIITTMQEVTERLTFLEELYHIVYTDCGKKMKERTEFQKILLDELWIFGDKYKYGTDDQSLKNVLKKHLKELTKDDDELTEQQQNNPDLNNIPDICLWNNQKIGDVFENLVVEIKRPTKKLGQKEWGQIERYAIAVANEPGFAQTNWYFVLIGNDYDEFVKTKLKSFNNNLIMNQENIKVKILKWADVIAENKLRYEYFKEKSKIVLQESDITNSINKRWEKLKIKAK